MKWLSFSQLPVFARLLPVMAAVLAAPVPVEAELQGLSETEMSSIDGAGIGLVLENFKFSHIEIGQCGKISKIPTFDLT